MSVSEITNTPPATLAQPLRGGLPEASLPESLAVLLLGAVPAIIRGLFSPRRRAVKLLSAIDADGRTVKLMSGVRRRHGGEGVRLLGGRLVVLWGEGAIREVLDHSAELYASDAGAKAKGMSHFQPDALTLSRGTEWRNRRAFNESVLASSDRVHPDGRRFLEVVADEVARLELNSTLGYQEWERLFDRITLRVIFGDGAREKQRLTELLEGLMREANRIGGLRPNDAYYELYGELERQLRDPEPGSLVARFAQAPHGELTRVVQQIPHWIFAMRDTLGANAFRALALVVSDPAVEQRVRNQLGSGDPTDPATIDGLEYLEGVLHETMRLWPTTPLLARETMEQTQLAGEQLESGTQVLLLNVYNHRDAEHVEEADRLRPERWSGARRDYRFNHLSNGSQDCPGGPLVLLLGKAVIAQVLMRFAPALKHPRLAPGGPLPHMLDFFQISFAVDRREPR